MLAARQKLPHLKDLTAPVRTEPGPAKVSPLVMAVLDYGERLLMLLLFGRLVLMFWGGLEARPYNILVLFSEGLIVAFILTRRPARAVTTRPMDWIIALMGTTLPLLVIPGAAPLAPPVVGATLMAAGLSVSIWAKLALQRSFGLAAANRGVVESGPYRLVRHPMYAGYLMLNLGFLLTNPSWWNAFLYVIVLTCQVTRILAEERLLSADDAYATMMRRVRFRLVPGVF